MAETLVEIKYDEAKLRRIRSLLRDVPNALPRVVCRGINRTASGARTQIVRRLSSETGLRQKDIRPGVTLSQRATYVSWLAQISMKGRGVSLMRFNPVQEQGGVVYWIGERHYFIRSAFLATMQSGHRGVFIRGIVVGYKGKLGYRPRPTAERKGGRLPIVERFGPAIGTLFERTANIADEITAETGKNLEKNIDDQVRLILGKAV